MGKIFVERLQKKFCFKFRKVRQRSAKNEKQKQITNTF